jgi:Ala-tRNA(Pro) deacylase
MPIVDWLKRALEEKGIRYSIQVHSRTGSAQEAAHALHVSGHELAKAVVVKVDEEEYLMLVLSAADHIDFRQLHRLLGTTNIRLATEPELGRLFPDCEIGAMPPFGTRYGMKVFVDAKLAALDDITYDGGTHLESVRMAFSDYARLAEPQLVRLSQDF